GIFCINFSGVVLPCSWARVFVSTVRMSVVSVPLGILRRSSSSENGRLRLLLALFRRKRGSDDRDRRLRHRQRDVRFFESDASSSNRRSRARSASFPKLSDALAIVRATFGAAVTLSVSKTALSVSRTALSVSRTALLVSRRSPSVFQPPLSLYPVVNEPSERRSSITNRRTLFSPCLSASRRRSTSTARPK